MKDFLHHLFIPRESNNHRSKILHHKSLFIVILFLFVSQFVLSFTKTNFKDVLGISSNINIDRLVELTNQKRAEQDLSPVILNNELSNAALLKAKDMFAKNYWAHNAPDGITPWVFIKQSGYEYVYAGENLARGFTASEDAVSAWMASPSHRDNIISPNYKEIGFAVLEGNLLGEDTILIVEMFGSKVSPTLARETGSEKIVSGKQEVVLIPTVAPTVFPLEETPKNEFEPRSEFVAAWQTKPLINQKPLSKNISVIVLLLFISALILDMIIIERRKIIRVVGHNLDHIFFLALILIFIFIFAKEGVL